MTTEAQETGDQAVATKQSDEILGLTWGGSHTCGARVGLLWVSPHMAMLQGLPYCLHIELQGATLYADGRILCDTCHGPVETGGSSPVNRGGIIHG